MLQYTAAVSVTAWLYYFESMTYRTIGSSQEKEGIEMVTLFVIGIFVFVVKLIHFAVKAAWIDEENKIVSFHAIDNGKMIMKAGSLFWDFLFGLTSSGYRIM